MSCFAMSEYRMRPARQPSSSNVCTRLISAENMRQRLLPPTPIAAASTAKRRYRRQHRLIGALRHRHVDRRDILAAIGDK